ncbi:DUF4303 domain-containing protein [uncultured Acinetobacter sp.]|uniref:DUF4303 domain-containing protein n=1 Tax=uncultured Acinetobacter sp. TaxID=165433 RepID=UPI00260896F1|nr:DUF4303 domain-containing protein [uncultured Acinetobacter sp.]
MLQHLTVLKDALIHEFYKLYDHYYEDEIYGCALVFNEYMLLDHLSVATQRSLFAEHEDYAQFLSQADKWNVNKWRFRSSSTDSQLHAFNLLLNEYLQQNHVFGTPLQQQNLDTLNNLDVLLSAFKDAKEALVDSYGLDVDQILFFISLPTQPNLEINSAQTLNGSSQLLQEFLQAKQHRHMAHNPARLKKLSQADKDMLVDIAQLVTIDPFDYLQIANQAYILTLDSTFADINPYIQKLIHTIAAMEDATFAMSREEILERIDQFYSHLVRQR